MREALMGRRNAAKLNSRLRLKAAATRLFEAYGYEKTTIRGIGAEAGFSSGAFFNHWPDKESLYTEIAGHPPVTPEIGRLLLQRMAGAALVFRGYEQLHRAKGPEGLDKAQRNADMAELLEGTLREAGWPMKAAAK